MYKIKFLIFILIFILYSCSIRSIENILVSDSPSKVYEYYIKSRIALNNKDIDDSLKYLLLAIELDNNSITFHRDLASLYLRKNMKEKALESIESFYLRNPDKTEALIIIGRIKELLNHDIEEVIAVYEKIISIDSKRASAYFFLGNIYFKNKRYKDANRIYLKHVKKYPKKFLGYYYLGKIAFNEKKFITSEKYLKKSISLSNDIPSMFLLAEVYRELKKIKKSISLYQKLLILDPLNIKAVFEYSFLTKLKDNFYLKNLSKYIQKKPEIVSQLRNYIIENKKYKESITILKFINSNLANKSDINYLIAVLYEFLKDSDNALKHYKLVKVKSNSFVKASISISSILQNRNKLKEASVVLHKVHNLIPKNEEIILYLGILYNILNQNEKAEKILKKGLKLNNKNYSLHYRLGIVYDAKKQKDLMFKEMKNVILLKPDHANALNYLGYSYADSGINLDEAESLIKRALNVKPNDGYITDSLGWVYYKKGFYRKASKYIKMALKKVPNDPIVLEHLGDIYKKLNDDKLALKYYKKALKYNDKDKSNLLKKIQELKIEIK
ncbi:MAG: tetratricopeptide repeat protein [Desulfobacterales bacterium]|nr:tetratricopeptide repeat protein [Desulfobacterales bacterium]